MTERSVKIIVTGLVQGVGFRPFVYRIAGRFGLTGWVQNTNENVRIEVTGNDGGIRGFISALENELPHAAEIENISVEDIDYHPFPDFSIRGSNDLSDQITEISPDIAVCNECIDDMKKPGNRLNYAFVNCTNCGPRFSIVEDLPYDRAKTTMSPFNMCPACNAEYNDVNDRRFHAQPAACNICGPAYELYIKGRKVTDDVNVITDQLAGMISDGGIVLIKGLGGMHLACDCLNEKSIERLRILKKRDGKPFATMFRDIESLKRFVVAGDSELRSLLSWRRPIVLLEKKKRKTAPFIPENLNAGLNMLGVMLPYMPFHHLLFEKLSTPAIVLTSGNFSNEPILTDNGRAIESFSEITDAIILHNRDIANRTDDSVVRIIGGSERIFRRSRGYAPAPVKTSMNTDGIIAFGAELSNCFCAGKGKKAYLSQHIGDLELFETTRFYEETISQHISLFRLKPGLVAIDMHPEYYSTRTGLNFGDLPVIMVQHHHAHIAACMAEYGLDRKVIGVAFDGTGYGTDGNIWGSEFLICDLKDFYRAAHYEYLPLPGGDIAVEQPWRMAVSWLYKVFGRSFTRLDIPLIRRLDRIKIDMLLRMMDRKVNCPLTCGAGRIFDAAASLLDLADITSFQAEGPMRLEAILNPDCTESYPFDPGENICLDPALRALIRDILNATDKGTISAKLHNTIIMTIFDTVRSIRSKEGINCVVLSGGVFQNKYLLSRITEMLMKNQFEVYSHKSVPTNDGGIALGQLAVASKRREV